MLAITSTDVSDEFADGSGKDTNNKGYWWKENIKYTITIDSSKETLYKNPVKLGLETIIIINLVQRRMNYFIFRYK